MRSTFDLGRGFDSGSKPKSNVLLNIRFYCKHVQFPKLIIRKRIQTEHFTSNVLKCFLQYNILWHDAKFIAAMK